MKDTYRVDLEKLSNYESSIQTELGSFTNNSRKTFLGGYLNTNSNPVISKMSLNINNMYSLIETGYKNINNWLNDYTSDYYNMELSLVSGITKSIKIEDLKNYLSSIADMIDIKIDETTVFVENTMLTFMNKNNNVDIENVININETESSNEEYINKLKEYFGEENIIKIDEYEESAYIELKNGITISLSNGEYYGCYIRSDTGYDYILFLNDLSAIKNIKSIKLLDFNYIESSKSKMVVRIKLKSGLELTKTYIQNVRKDIILEEEISDIKYNGINIPINIFNDIDIFDVESFSIEDNITKIKMSNGLLYHYDENNKSIGNYVEYDGQTYDVSTIVNSPNVEMDIKKIYFFNNKINVYLKDKSTLVYDLEGNLIKKIFDGRIYTKEDYLYEFVKEIANKYNKSEEWAVIYLNLMNHGQFYKDEEKMIKYVDMFYKLDSKNGYELLHTTPILCVGTKELDIGGGSPVQYRGKWYKMYNEYGIEFNIPVRKIHLIKVEDENGDYVTKEYEVSDEEILENELRINYEYYQKVLKEMNKYSDYYLESIEKQLKETNLVSYTDDSSFEFAAFATSDGIVVIDASYSDSLYGIGTFNHELGHEFDFSKSKFTHSDEWKEVYRQIQKADPKHKLLRDCAYNSKTECWAEIMAEYYNIDGTTDDFYNPDDLKAIHIDYNGYTNLYDYIDDLVNGRLEN